MIIFAWRRLPPPAFIGGAEISEGLCAAALASAGARVTFVGSAQNPRDPSDDATGWLSEVLAAAGIQARRTPDGLAYEWRGVSCQCVPQRAVASVVDRQIAAGGRILWTSQEGCDEIAALSRNRVQIASYIHSVTEVGLLSARIPATWRFAPSEFVQRLARTHHGAESILLRPPVEAGTAGPEAAPPAIDVLFVNPIVEKGVELAVKLASRLPRHRFVFVEAWRTCDVPPRSLPPNVTVLRRRPSLASLMSASRLLIVPSLVDDAAPRVVMEAAAAGLPAIGADRGGIPEMIADRRSCLDPLDLRAWTRRVEALLGDETLRRRAGVGQRRHWAGMRKDPVSVFAEAGILATP
ncbi:MAG: hypothetical protein QOG93_859 [Gaiellaceae bacterium]|nr:hypothetical protein [Gaiellaceae bacterium]